MLIGSGSGGKNMPQASGKSFKQGGRTGGVIRTKTISPTTGGYRGGGSSGMAKYMAKLGKRGS